MLLTVGVVRCPLVVAIVRYTHVADVVCSSKGAPGSAGDWVMITGPYPPSADVLPYPALHNHNCVSSASLADALCVSY